MEVKTVITLTQIERAKIIECVTSLRSICATMHCPSSVICETCPFDKITDKAHDLADEMTEILHKCEVEGE